MIRRLICRLFGHVYVAHTNWLDCGYENWAECRRCGEVWPP